MIQQFRKNSLVVVLVSVVNVVVVVAMGTAARPF
jgi:hypothetical protein